MLGPIFLREWLTVPRRSRHYVTRSAYLGILWVLGLTAWQASVGWNRTATLGDTARFGLLLFQIVIYVQLTFLLFFSALSAASAITLEKDRRTFILLLLTDLRNYEIVLGKLVGSTLQIVLLLAGIVPVLAMIVLLGGVSPEQVGQALLVLAATGFAAGSLGCLIALWREKTFQVLAMTVLCLVLYLCLVQALAVLPAITNKAVSASDVHNWQGWLNPFLTLLSVLDPAGDEGRAIVPAYGFAGVMISLGVLLNVWGIVRLRKWNPSGEPIMQRERPEDQEEKDRASAHAAPGAVRHVWTNPIVWREICTRAYGRRAFLVKFAYFLVLGMIGYYSMSPLMSEAAHSEYAAAQGLVPIAILSLLLVSAQAVTAITTERDTGALDLLLVTDLTPKEFIFGKLGGILYNTKEFLIPPLLVVIFYAWQHMMARPPRAHPELAGDRNLEAALCAGAALVLLLAFAIVIGLHVALRTLNSRLAIINTLGTIFFLSVGTLICIYLIIINGRFEYQWTSFVFFIIAGVGGLWWVLNGERPSAALTLAAWLCPFAMFYSVTNIIVAKPGTEESADPLVPFLVTGVAFGFALAAMLVPLVSEFDVALGRTSAGGE